MIKKNRAVHTVLAGLLSIFLLAACNGAEEPAETETSPTTGEAGAFEISGTVRAVEVEDGEASPTPSPTDDDEETPAAGATGTPGAGTTPTPTGPLARLVIEIESINPEPAELCDVDEGDTVTLVVTEATAIDPQRSLQDLEEIVDRTITAAGNAEELAEDDQTGTPGATPGEATPGAGTEGTPATPGQGTTGTPATPTPTGTPGIIGNLFDQTAGQGCHFEVVQLTIEEEEGATPGTGGLPTTPTPAPAGGQGNIGGTDDTPTPGAAGTTPDVTGTGPGGQATPQATPTPGGAGTAGN